jgi:AAA+ superfamily predicted ATPase
MNTTDKYKKEIRTLSESGCGVMFTRTREPYRAVEAIHELAFAEGLPFGRWDVINGWVVNRPSDAVGAKPEQQKVFDPLSAMKWLMDVDGGWTEENQKAPGYFVMHAIHPWMEKFPAIIELLRQYVRILPTMSKRMRLILVVPEHVNLSDELSHDIPTVDFDLPSIEEMGDLFHYVVGSTVGEGEVAPEMFTNGERETVSAAAGGLTQMEAELAFSRAIVENKLPEEAIDTIPFAKFNRTVLDAKTEIIKQSEVLELMEPVDMSEVGGLDILKEWINVAALSFSEEARAFGVGAPAGIAAIGPPGTGKTLIGKAIATVLGQPLVKFDVSKCFGSLVGQSESRVRSALKQLEAMGRVTVLFDEIDKSLGGSHQGGGDSGVSQRVLGAILTFMQETKAPIFPIYTANRTDSLPPELLRKGRLDEVFAVMPPNREEREAILRIHLKKRKQSLRGVKDLSIAVTRSKGYVSAELEAGVKEAVKFAFVKKVPVTGQLIADMLGQMRPLAEAFPEDFARMSEWAKANARLASSPSEEVPVEAASTEASPRRRRIGNK